MPVIAIIISEGRGRGKRAWPPTWLQLSGTRDRFLLLDCDPQRSASGWAALGPQPRLNLAVENVEAGALVRRVRDGNRGTRLGRHRLSAWHHPGERGRHPRGRRGSHSLQAPSLGRVGLRRHSRSREIETGCEPRPSQGRVHHYHGTPSYPFQPADQWSPGRPWIAHLSGTHHGARILCSGGRRGHIGAGWPGPGSQG